MENDSKEVITDSPETSEEVVEETTEETPEVAEEPKEEKVEKPKETPEQRLARLRRMVQQEEKRQGVVKEVKPETKKADLSQVDVLELATAISAGEMHKDDQNEVINLAKAWNMTVGDVLKNPTGRAILGIRKEERQTAAATQTKGGAKGPSKPMDILARARKGQLPESYEDISRLAEARILERVEKRRK